MEEHPVDHPGVPAESYTYHTLGKKTLWIFVLQRIHTAAIVLVFAIGLFALKDQPFLANVPVVHDLRPYMQMVTLVAFGLFIIVFLITFLVAWLIYLNYKFALGDDALKIKQGIFNKEETAIPYRQIQNVDIERDLTYQMFGLSRIVILTAGEEEEKAGEDESEGILPGLDKDLAEWLQAELLKRANVQKVVEEKN
jgi:uncharacterized membrane protein YdbT with pleckstrin-like domain